MAEAGWTGVLMPALIEQTEARDAAQRDPERAARAATRLILRFVKTRLLAASAMLGGDLTGALVVLAISHANVDHLDADERLSSQWSAPDSPAPDDLRRPVSGYVAAQWLGMSRETLRRKVNILIERGILERVEDGYRIKASALATPEAVAHSLQAFNAARDLFRALGKWGYVPEELMEQAASGPPRPRMAGRALNAFIPPTLDNLRAVSGGDVTSAVVLAGIVNDALSEPPVPTSAQGLARRLGLSRETTRRHAADLVERGLVRRTSAGLIAPDDLINGAVRRAILDRAAPYRMALLERLARAGVLSSSPLQS